MHLCVPGDFLHALLPEIFQLNGEALGELRDGLPALLPNRGIAFQGILMRGRLDYLVWASGYLVLDQIIEPERIFLPECVARMR